MVLPRLSRRARVLDLAAKLAKRHSGERLTRTGRYLVPLPSLKNAEAPRVLLVEDNAVNQMIVKAALNKMGAQCTVAGNGRVALEELARATFDLVLMDIQMPVMDGYEATRAIRARETSGFRMPIVALTANTTLEDRESAFAAGMDAFLTKPVRIEELRATVVNLTERQRAAAVMS
jgi:CheY-like chemotaxis protein